MAVIILRKFLIKDGKVYIRTAEGWAEFGYKEWKEGILRKALGLKHTKEVEE